MLALGNPLRTQSTAVHPFPAGFVWGASLGDSATPSTRIRFSVHTGEPNRSPPLKALVCDGSRGFGMYCPAGT
jgi:hypothetical protein